MFVPPPPAYPPPVRRQPPRRPAAEVPAVPRDLPPPLALARGQAPEPPRFAPVAIPGPGELGVRLDDDPPAAVPIPAPGAVGIDVD